MAKRKKKVEPPEFPKVIETFRKPGAYDLSRYMHSAPSCFNGCVEVERYRITIEKIDEPKDVLEARLRKLWRECNNHHHYYPIKATAERLGVKLDLDEYGEDRDKKPRERRC